MMLSTLYLNLKPMDQSQVQMEEEMVIAVNDEKILPSMERYSSMKPQMKWFETTDCPKTDPSWKRAKMRHRGMLPNK